MSGIDIFSSAKPQSGKFFAFKNVGDSIQGTYIDVRNGIDSFGNQQTIYVLQDANGEVWNLGFRLTALVIHERMNGIRFGQIVGFRFDEHRDSKRNPGTKVKIIRIYADPKLVDQEWLDHQKAVEANYARPSAAVVAAEVKEEEEDPFDDDDIPFGAPSSAAPATGNLPKAEEKPRNEAVDAIRNLAKTKGLTSESMTEEEADAVIEKYTGLSLTEENLTKVIISLTGYVSK
jgi:hypothetical protein